MSYLTSNTDWWIDDAIELASHPIYTYTASVNTDWRFVRMTNNPNVEITPVTSIEQNPVDPDWKDLI